MSDAKALSTISTHLASVSRMLTEAERRGLDEVCAAAATHAMAIVSGACAGVVLLSDGEGVTGDPSGVRSSSARVVASVRGEGPDLPDLLFLGPAVAGIEHNAVIVVDDTSAPPARWSGPAAVAAEYGIAGLRAFPIRGGSVPAGSLVVGTADPWTGEGAGQSGAHRDPMGVQVLADLIGVALRLSGESESGADLPNALSARTSSAVTFERAVGIVAEKHELTIPGATDVVRGLARRTRRPVSEVADRIVARASIDLPLGDIVDE